MKRKLRIDSLKKKIGLSIFVTIALCAVFSALIVSRVVEDRMTDKYQVDREAATEFLSYSLAPMLELYDYRQVERVITSSLTYESIALVAVFDNTGTLVRSAQERDPAAAELDVERHDITSNGKVVGSFEVGFSSDYIDKEIRTMTAALTLGVVGFLVLLGLALLTFLNRSLIAPIEAFTKTVKQISPRNLSVRMKMDREDELGTLATNFNRVAADLEESHKALQVAHGELEQEVEERTKRVERRSEQLRAIYEVRRRISSILSLDELLPYVVSSLQETFDYYCVNTLLLDRASGDLVLEAGAGRYEGDIPVGRHMKATEGIAGWVARNGEPLLVNDVTREARYLFVPELPHTRSELAAPIRIGTDILGVLDIQSTRPEAFYEMDLLTAQTIADEVANAYENARLYRETRDMAVLEERNRMAREIHDTLAQGFTGIVLQLEAAEQALEGKKPESAQEHFDRARSLARESLSEARRSVWSLRPRALEQLPLIDTLRQETESFARDSALKTSFTTSGESYPLHPDVEPALLRICQESLTNVRKHARASEVEVRLAFKKGLIGMSIRDDGVGFDPAAPTTGTLGLTGMRERVRLLGGTLTVQSQKGKGTLVKASIPTTQEADKWKS